MGPLTNFCAVMDTLVDQDEFPHTVVAHICSLYPPSLTSEEALEFIIWLMAFVEHFQTHCPTLTIEVFVFEAPISSFGHSLVVFIQSVPGKHSHW